MKKQIVLILVLAVMLGVSACAKAPDADVEEKPGLQAFTSTDINGESVDQTIFEGYDLTMVNIWATFCSPCIGEMPDLALLNEDYADQSFQVVGIVADAVEGDEAQLQSALTIIEQTGAYYTHILTSENLYNVKLKSVQYVPETIFVDAEGNQVGESYVGSKNYEDWSEIIEALLDEVAQ